MLEAPPMTLDLDLPERQEIARAWFETFRDRLCDALEAIEDAADPALYPGAAGRFERTPWKRDGDGGGGVASMLRGRVFEKAGVHVSTVWGEFTPEFAKNVPGADQDPRFHATGVSVIIHPRNPHVPTAHMNTRLISTTKSWFGGGGDLTPVLNAQRTQDNPDAVAFHAAMQAACDAHDPSWHAKYKTWCDEYFFLPHRNEPRGIGGIFYDHHDSGDFARDFGFTRDVGMAFLDSYTAIVRGRMAQPWTPAERDEQLIRRGRYVEFNLLYDRGTTFGLKTGGNVESILSSMPPEVKWP